MIRCQKSTEDRLRECPNEPRLRPVGTTTAVYRQCLLCGDSIGQALPKSAHPDAPPWDSALEVRIREHDDHERAKSAAVHRDRRTEMEEQKHQRREDYCAYLDSPEWWARRRLALERDRGLCKAKLLGCAEWARRVHHKTYENLFNEPLFDLESVCVPCHEQIHGRRLEQHTYQPPAPPDYTDDSALP